MSPDKTVSTARSLGPRLFVAAAALAYGAHMWFVRWDLAATNVLLPLLGATYLALYFWGWGAVLVRLPALRRDDAIPEPALVLSLGIGAGSLAVLGLGTVCLLRLSVFGPLSVVFVVLGLWKSPPWRMFRPREPGFRLLDVPLIAVLGTWAILVLALAFVPDATFDTLAYHLATMKLYVQHGSIVALPWLFHSNFPIGVDFVFLHGLLLGNDQIAVLLALLLGLLAAAATWRLARSYLSSTHSLLAVLLFALSPEVAESINTCQVELGWTVFAVLSLWCALEWRRGEGRIDRWLHLAAVFAGLAGGTKVPGLIAGAAVGAIVLLSRPPGGRRGLAPIVRFAWVFLLVASPCYVKSWIHTGTPLWPLSLGVFHPRHWNDEIHQRFLSHWGRWAHLTVVSPVPFALAVARAAWRAGGWPVWLFLLLLGASALAWRRAREIWPLLLFSLFHFLFWCLVTQQSRFLLPAIPAMVVGLIRLTRRADDPARTPIREGAAGRALFGAANRIAITGFGAALLLAVVPSWSRKIGYYLGRALPLLRGDSSREQILEREDLYRACARTNESTPPGSRILLLGENRGYWLDREYMWGDDFNQAVIDYSTLLEPDEFRARLAELGITHALVGRFWQGEGLRLTSALADLLVTKNRVPIDRSYELYDLGRPAADDRPLVVSSSVSKGYLPQAAMDGREVPGVREGWMSRGIPTPDDPEQLLVLYPRTIVIRRIRLASHPDPRLALSSFVFHYDRGGTWTEIPETRTEATADSGQWTFDIPPFETRRLRLQVFGSRSGAARVVEIATE